MINPIEETSLIIVDHDQRFFTPTEHPSKILIRTYNDDGSTKSLFIDDSMFIRDVLFLLIHKNHREPDVNYALIEVLPELHMGKRLPTSKVSFEIHSNRFRTDFRRSSEINRSDSHVANDLFESTGI